MLAQGVRRRTHCALRAPFKQLRQVSARSACVLRHTHPPPALRFSARTEGNPANIHSGHRVARPSLRSAWHLRQRGGAERSNGPCGCSAVHPPAGCACGGVVAGWHGRRSAHASCSDSPWLSERRCAAAKRVPRRTPQPPRRRLPLRTAKGSQTGGRLSFGYFSLAKQRKVPRPPGRLPAPTLNRGMRFNQRTRNPHYKINSYQRISQKRIQPKTPQTGPKAIRPEEVTDASLACRVSTRLRPARFAS